MAIAGFSTKYRTLKIGFLIREGSVDDLVAAVKINTLLWGGIHNPIIPVGEDTKKTIDLVRSIPVDLLHPISHNKNIDNVLNTLPFLKTPRHFTYEMFTEDWHTKKKSLVYLDSLNIIERHYHKYFKGVPAGKGGSNCVLVKWQETDPLADFFTIAFGSFLNNFNLKDDFEIAFLKGLRAQEITIDATKDIPDNIGGKISPIGLTDIDLKNYRPEYFRDNGVYIGDPNSFDDLIYFWNLRATGLRLEFLPVNGHERFIAFIQKHIDTQESLIEKRPNFHRTLIFYYRNKNQNDIDVIYKKFKSKDLPLYVSNISETDTLDFLKSLPTDYLNWETANGFVEESFERISININLPPKKFIIDDGDRDVSSQSLAISIDSFGDFGGYTLKLPFLPSLNEFYSREITFDPWKVRSEESGFGVIIDLHDKDINLYPIAHQVLINKIFDLAGIKARKSQAGLLTQEIINSMRENEPLEACRVFKVKGVRTLIKSLKKDASITYTGALKIIGKDNFDRHKKLYIESREEPELKPQDVFGFLIKKRIFKPVLSFYEKILRRKKEYKCSNCGLASMIRYTDFEDSWRCGYCEHDQYLPNFIASEFKRNNCWSFKKRGLFGKENNQEGAIPVILSLLVLKHIFTHGNFLYSTSLICDGCDSKPEMDFVLFQYDLRDNGIELAIGECKSDGGEITTDDIRKMKSVKDKFTKINIHCHLVFAKTSDTFSAEEIKLFKELEKEHCSFVLLLNQELETNHHLYWEDADFEKLPYKYALTLNELGINSRFRYLNQPAVIAQGN